MVSSLSPSDDDKMCNRVSRLLSLRGQSTRRISIAFFWRAELSVFGEVGDVNGGDLWGLVECAIL